MSLIDHGTDDLAGDALLPAGIEADDGPTRKKGFGLGAYLSAGWLILVAAGGLLADFLPLSNPNSRVGLNLQAPFQDMAVPLGADSGGRDILARLIYGGRLSLLIAFAAIMFGMIIGGTLGLLAGYFRTWVGNVLVSLFDILLAIPSLVLALSLVAVLKGDPNIDEGLKLPTTLVIILSLGIVAIPLLARITRASTLTWAQRDFVTAARAQGAGDGRILFREVLPNVLPAMVSLGLLSMAIAIVAEGGLAVLGAGIDAPTATWGNMISDGKNDLADAPFVVFLPIVALFLTAMSLNYLGDAIRDKFDVRESSL